MFPSDPAGLPPHIPHDLLLLGGSAILMARSGRYGGPIVVLTGPP